MLPSASRDSTDVCAGTPQGHEHFPPQSGLGGPGVRFHLHALEVLSLGVSRFYCLEYRTHFAPSGTLILFSLREFGNFLLSMGFELSRSLGCGRDG